MKEGVLELIVVSVTRSIKRVRTTLLVSIIASIIAFISFYNTLSDGWIKSRVKHRLELKEWCSEIETLESGVVKFPNGSKRKEHLEAIYEDDEHCCDHVEDIAQNAVIQREQLISNVKIPWLGVAFDINDLSLLGGLAFTIIMLTLSYNLGLKYSNLHTAFKVIEKIDDVEERSAYFDAIGMAQILATPNRSAKVSSPSILIAVPYILFSLPFLVQSVVFINDTITIVKVIESNMGFTLFSLVGGAIFWIILLSLTLSCIKLDKRTHELWSKFEEKLKTSNERNLD